MILKHRDRELLRFEWIDPQGVRVLSVNETERRFLPLEMKGEKADDLLTIADKPFIVNPTDSDVEYTVSSDTLAYQIKQNMRADPFITTTELAGILNVSSRWVARKIKGLQVAGEIKRVGADKNGHWEVV